MRRGEQPLPSIAVTLSLLPLLPPLPPVLLLLLLLLPLLEEPPSRQELAGRPPHGAAELVAAHLPYEAVVHDAAGPTEQRLSPLVVRDDDDVHPHYLTPARTGGTRIARQVPVAEEVVLETHRRPAVLDRGQRPDDLSEALFQRVAPRHGHVQRAHRAQLPLLLLILLLILLLLLLLLLGR